jgi:hypothetical protein
VHKLLHDLGELLGEPNGDEPTELGEHEES